jgi:hypothetical protein
MPARPWLGTGEPSGSRHDLPKIDDLLQSASTVSLQRVRSRSEASARSIASARIERTLATPRLEVGPSRSIEIRVLLLPRTIAKADDR